MATNPQQQLTPKKHALTVGGGSLFGTGSCLLWTVILIPLAIPLMFIGFVMMIASRFVKTEPIACPACGAASTVELTVPVIVCPHCNNAIRRANGAWVRV